MVNEVAIIELEALVAMMVNEIFGMNQDKERVEVLLSSTAKQTGFLGTMFHYLWKNMIYY
jgi:hypothetical protein